MKIYQILGHFLIGVSDSLSLSWVKGILFYTDPISGKILPQSIKLQRVLLRSIVQAGLITTLLPIILSWLGYTIVSWIVMVLSLLWTYVYLSFYNMDVTKQTFEIIVWKTKKSKETMPQLDVRQKIDPITDISNQIQSFIFRMAFYTPVSLLLIIFTLFQQRYFPWLLAIMDAFFNTAFYFFRKWPYDKYNVAFLQSHMSYALGYGAFVSIMTDIILPPSMSIGGYLLISQWMIINALYHSPPKVEFNSFAQILQIFKGDNRKKKPSGYNIHRYLLRKDKQYRHQIMVQCYFMQPFFKLTAKINYLIHKHLFKQQTQDYSRNEEDTGLSRISQSSQRSSCDGDMEKKQD